LPRAVAKLFRGATAAAETQERHRSSQETARINRRFFWKLSRQWLRITWMRFKKAAAWL
jgi:hypothetical protein